MSKTTQLQAVIYCRVSSYKHTEKECALNSQENRCREFEKYKGYEVNGTKLRDFSMISSLLKSAKNIGPMRLLYVQRKLNLVPFGYEVVNVFHDNGVSGNKKDRSGMNALLEFLGEQENETIVIIKDIARLARDVSVHLQLRNEIIKAGGKLESPTIEFGDDPQSKYLENILASVSQCQN